MIDKSCDKKSKLNPLRHVASPVTKIMGGEEREDEKK